MALTVVQTIAPCVNYGEWNGDIEPYNPYLVTAPRHYMESINSISSFFYEPGNDILVAYVTLDIIYWPGWAVFLYKWDAGTGDYLGRQVVWSPYLRNAGIGSYNKIFGEMSSDSHYHLYELNWQTLQHEGGIVIDSSSWPSPGLQGAAVINLEDNLLVGINSLDLLVWSLGSSPAVQGQLRLPNTLAYLAYENRDNCWVIMQGGLIAKANYKRTPPRWEMLSAVQNPASDATNYLCLYDTKRLRLVVLRQRPDAADGACRCQLEFYRPIYQATSITDPVPISPLRPGGPVQFVSHLLGAAGEGVSSRTLNASLVSPAVGQLLSPSATVELNGAAVLHYVANQAGDDTLQLSVEDLVQ